MNPNGQPTSYWFVYGTSTAYRQSTTAASDGSGRRAVPELASLSGLTAGRTYHYRIAASNATGTSYGAAESFTTAPSPGPSSPPAAARSPGLVTPPASTGASSSINPAPTGAAAPSSGWSVAFADDFNAPLGSGAGQDSFWYPNRLCCNANTTQNGDNPYDLQAYNSSQVTISGGDLVETAKPDTDALPAQGGYQQADYLSGSANTDPQAGNTGFEWKPGQGETWAFEIDAEFPTNTNDLFNSFWSISTSGWNNERDFFEGRPSSWIDSDWFYNPSGGANDWYASGVSFNPASAFHHYTYVVYPNQTWSFYIDGVLQTWVGNNGIGPAEASTNTYMNLIINYALYNYNGSTYGTTDPNFTSGTRSFKINSVAVYEDAAHTGQDIIGGGIALDTTID
jgi:hypothetical protein